MLPTERESSVAWSGEMGPLLNNDTVRLEGMCGSQERLVGKEVSWEPLAIQVE